MITHSSILAWRIPWTEEPSGLQPLGTQMSQTQLSDLGYMQEHCQETHPSDQDQFHDRTSLLLAASALCTKL